MGRTAAADPGRRAEPSPLQLEAMTTERPRILVVDDEEAILETMTFTFQDDYEVVTANDPRKALEILDEQAPFAVVLTDQRMPEMSGVEFVTEVCRRHPATVRMILTGFSDMDAIIQAINDGHVYAYITKPWEPEQLKQVMKQAVEHYKLTVENERLLADLRRANRFLAAVMDELDVGAIAVDADGVVQAVNRPVRDYLGLSGDAHGRPLESLLAQDKLQAFKSAAKESDEEEGDGASVAYHDVDVDGHRFRVTRRNLVDESGASIGHVVLFREISHEPLQRRVNELLGDIVGADEDLRAVLEHARDALPSVAAEVASSPIESAGMRELAERISRTRTAIDHWLEVDDALARDGFPDAQSLRDRIRIATSRWPLGNELPARVRELARRVEEYYESGEKPNEHVL
jgi:CheY-like chemotaxis protein